ncbi:MAG TPA: alpha-D-ribose 1-methylphosphonate 5-triphosphate diphosphatase, partial [Mucilaginibacter sp.]|nr:alpha-D-ribose 1-methylphosphonate 5-triphosphate diphosphatase [Mucilaginibacter sp.]
AVLVENGVIAGIGTGAEERDDVTVIDAEGSVLMPGIIDIHTDALESEVTPRPGADIPIAVALRELERKMSGCGFTTVYHSLHLGYDTAVEHSRSKFGRREMFEEVARLSQGKTLINNKIHLRFELTGVHAYETCFELMDKGCITMLSVMDHTPGQGQISKAQAVKFFKSMGKTEEEAIQTMNARLAAPIIEGEKLEAMIAHAQKLHIPVASHDDDTVEKVNYMHSLGVDICEFPINMETAQRATEIGMHVVGGASNVLRGGSLSGNLDIKDAILQDAVDTLCSDYYPPAILHSVFKLHYENGLPLSQAVNLATLNPARAAEIDHHIGSIETGKDADLILVKLTDGLPMVTHTIVRGEVVARAIFKTNETKSLKHNDNLSVINELQ